jgi:hypothetical protein
LLGGLVTDRRVSMLDKMLVLEAGKPIHYGTTAEVMKALQTKALA